MVTDCDCGRVNLKLVCVQRYRGAVFIDMQADQGQLLLPDKRGRSHVLNDHNALVGEIFKVRLESQVIVEWLDISGQHFAGSSNCSRSMVFGAEVSAHISSMRAVSPL
jgi:hypothetical protein